MALLRFLSRDERRYHGLAKRVAAGEPLSTSELREYYALAVQHGQDPNEVSEAVRHLLNPNQLVA